MPAPASPVSQPDFARQSRSDLFEAGEIFSIGVCSDSCVPPVPGKTKSLPEVSRALCRKGTSGVGMGSATALPPFTVSRAWERRTKSIRLSRRTSALLSANSSPFRKPSQSAVATRLRQCPAASSTRGTSRA
jgi:hypothetical protein